MSLRSYFQSEKRRLFAYRLLEKTFLALIVFSAAFQFGSLSQLFLEGFQIPVAAVRGVYYFALGVGGLGALWLLVKGIRNWRTLKFKEVAGALERKWIQPPNSKGELIAAGSFLDTEVRGTFGSQEFEAAHIDRWNKKLPQFKHNLKPSVVQILLALASALSIFATREVYLWQHPSLPHSTFAWSPKEFEARLPFAEAKWEMQTGSVGGISGSDVRFHPPRFSFLKSFVYIQESGQHRWSRLECKNECEFILKERGLYAVGTAFSRSPFFPLQVAPDEAPRGVLLVRSPATNELIPSATVEVVNKKSIGLQATASDDIQIAKVEVRHRFQDQDSLAFEWQVADKHFKRDFDLSLESWKGGKHEIYLRIWDLSRSADSQPVLIFFADSETLRAKRMLDLRALIDEWVHVLGDLLETERDQKVAKELFNRLERISYPAIEESSLMAAYVRELQRLSDKIQQWGSFAPNLSLTKSFVGRTEKQILYGLSLLFQEKTGEVNSTADNLRDSQKSLNKLLDDIKSGKTPMNSKELDEAFKNLVEKLAELQKKIRELPQGPNDELLNRDALDQQADEADALAQRIEEIKKQLQSGDSKGALREMESLLNQLSILSKEMERALDQWQQNLDKGTMQSAQRFQKKLEEIKKKQDALAKKTEKLKEKFEREQMQSTKPSEKSSKELAKEFKDSEIEQQKLSKEFGETTDQYDKDLEGSEWKEALRSDENKAMEEQIGEKMESASGNLKERQTFEALTNQREASALLSKEIEKQKQMQKQMQQSIQPGGGQRKEATEKMDIVSSGGKGEKERRRKIMESLRQKVDEKYQKSHEQYFEDMMQR